ncbi:LCP family protein [Faecalitalea cylindroides]|nr:LCP family protein [Faecalitalea cylindroides]
MRKAQTNEKNSIVYRVFAGILSVFLIVLLVGLIYQIFTLDLLPGNLTISVSILILLLTAIFLVLLNFVSRRVWSKVISVFLCVLLGVGYGFGNLYLYQTSSTLNSITDSNEGKVKNTVSVIVKDASVTELDDLSGKNVGVLKTIDSQGTKKSQNDIEKQDVAIQTKSYDNLTSEVKALYDGEVDAIIMNEMYRPNVEEIEEYTNFSNETNVVYQTVFYTDSSNEALVVDDITQNPFTILISGNDTYGEIDEVSRSDVNMLVTVNPVTSTVLMVNIPRDYYVQTSFGMDKLTHTGMYGIEETKTTIENLLGIDINYTFRVNFSSAEDIVDALDGVDIYVEEGMAVERLNADWALEGVTEGWNHLDGKRALAYARERHAYVDGDIQRAKNQQQVLEAIINKAASSKILTNYTQLLESFEGAFETNMSTSEITTLIKYELQALPEWKFENYVLRGYGDMAVCASSNMELSVVLQDDYCVQIASEKIQAVLNGGSADEIVDEYQTEAGGVAEGYIEQENAEAYAQQYYYDPNQYYDSSQVYDDSQYYDQSQGYTDGTDTTYGQ